jgi:hypothetical protein
MELLIHPVNKLAFKRSAEKREWDFTRKRKMTFAELVYFMLDKEKFSKRAFSLFPMRRKRAYLHGPASLRYRPARDQTGGSLGIVPCGRNR